jgi:hypothetical protein
MEQKDLLENQRAIVDKPGKAVVVKTLPVFFGARVRIMGGHVLK